MDGDHGEQRRRSEGAAGGPRGACRGVGGGQHEEDGAGRGTSDRGRDQCTWGDVGHLAGGRAVARGLCGGLGGSQQPLPERELRGGGSGAGEGGHQSSRNVVRLLPAAARHHRRCVKPQNRDQGSHSDHPSTHQPTRPPRALRRDGMTLQRAAGSCSRLPLARTVEGAYLSTDGAEGRGLTSTPPCGGATAGRRRWGPTSRERSHDVTGNLGRPLAARPVLMPEYCTRGVRSQRILRRPR